MNTTINIHKKNELVELTPGICKIDILGGWNVKLGDFTISLKNINSKETLHARKVISVQSYIQKQKAKRIFVIDILQAGTYEVEFIKPETLVVKYSNLPIIGLFSKKLLNQNLKVSFTN